MLEDEPKVLHVVAGPHVNEVVQNHADNFCQTLPVFLTHTHNSVLGTSFATVCTALGEKALRFTTHLLCLSSFSTPW